MNKPIKTALALALLAAAGCAADTADDPGKPGLMFAPEPFSCVDPPGEGSRAPNLLEIFLCSPTTEYDAHELLYCAKANGEPEYACVVDIDSPDGTWYSYRANAAPMTGKIMGFGGVMVSYATGSFDEHDCADDRGILLPPEWCP